MFSDLRVCGFSSFAVCGWLWLWFCYVCWVRAAGCGLAVFGVVVCFLAESGLPTGVACCWLLICMVVVRLLILLLVFGGLFGVFMIGFITRSCFVGWIWFVVFVSGLRRRVVVLLWWFIV